MSSARPQGSSSDQVSSTTDFTEPSGTAQTRLVGPGDTPPTPGNDTRFPVTFSGSGAEYFRIWIVNILLSIVTLYVYSAWAKVRTQRYFAGNTVIDGSAFEYHATGMQIFLGRVVAVALLMAFIVAGMIHPILQAAASILLVLGLPWVVWRSIAFTMRVQSYRNVRFGFSASLSGAYRILLVWPFLPIIIGAIIAAGASLLFDAGAVAAVTMLLAFTATILIMPLTQQKMAHYCLNGFRFGQARFAANPSVSMYYGFYLKAFGIFSLAAVVMAASLAAIIGVIGIVSAEGLEAFAESMQGVGSTAMLAPMALIYLSLFLTGYVVKAYLSVRIREHLLAKTLLDEKINFESTMRVFPLLWLLVSNLLLLIVTIGLATPWTRVRLARYEAENTVLHSATGLHAVVAAEHTHQSSLGEEIGEAFDMNADIGF